MGFQIDALRERAADMSAALWASGLEAPVSSVGTRRELRCPDCGYGAVVAHPLRRCPMCGGGDWQLIEAFSPPDRDGAGRS
jgi:rubrerythrin